MWKFTRWLKKVSIWAVILWTVGYIFSPKIQWATHKAKNHLVKDLDLKNRLGSDTLYATSDDETNTTLDLLSWFADKWDFNALLHKYWYDSVVHIDSLVEPDQALYKVIWQMHQKYGNPFVTLSKAMKNPLTWKEQFDRAAYNGFTNTINLHKLDSLKIEFLNVPQRYLNGVYNNDDVTLPKSTNKDWQRYLINNWIAEIAHSSLRQEDWPVRMWIDAARDLTKVGYKHSKLYDKPWSYEYNAHTVTEPKMAVEFIELYKKYSDLKNPEVQYKIGLFYNWYFDHYHDQWEAEKWLQLAAQSKNKEAHYILGKRYLKEYVWYNSKDTLQQRIDEIDSTTTNIMEKIMSDKENVLQNMLFHFWKSARAWSINAYLKLIDICKKSDFANSKKLWIGYAIELIHKRPDLLKKNNIAMFKWSVTASDVANVYMDLAYLYFADSQLDKYNEWKKKAEDAWYKTPIDTPKP